MMYDTFRFDCKNIITCFAKTLVANILSIAISGYKTSIFKSYLSWAFDENTYNFQNSILEPKKLQV